MKIKILGSGGAVNDGLPYNSFLIDDGILVETPPDIMLSLYRENIQALQIQEIYISHFHGDHSFGFPFLMLRMFFDTRGAPLSKPMPVYVPSGGDEYLLSLSAMALSSEHPCLSWIRKCCRFVTIGHRKQTRMGRYTAGPYSMNHFFETFGFILYMEDEPLFSYIADTLWCDSVEQMLLSGPRVILLDLNGEPADPVRVHLSEGEVIEKALPLAAEHTLFYGTHLKKQKFQTHERIRYVQPGEVIEI